MWENKNENDFGLLWESSNTGIMLRSLEGDSKKTEIPLSGFENDFVHHHHRCHSIDYLSNKGITGMCAGRTSVVGAWNS